MRRYSFKSIMCSATHHHAISSIKRGANFTTSPRAGKCANGNSHQLTSATPNLRASKSPGAGA
jgi:hypothetical protein